MNRTLTINLQKLVKGKNLERWDSLLPAAVFAYNTTEHSATGFTPHFLTFGCEARIPSAVIVGYPEGLDVTQFTLRQVNDLSDAYESARDSLGAAQRRMKDKYDVGAAARLFEVGDKVRVRLVNLNAHSGSKLEAKWSEQRIVVRVEGAVIYVKDPRTGTAQPLHCDRLLKSNILEDPADSDSDDDYDPEKTVDETLDISKSKTITSKRVGINLKLSVTSDCVPRPARSERLDGRPRREAKPTRSNDFEYSKK